MHDVLSPVKFERLEVPLVCLLTLCGNTLHAFVTLLCNTKNRIVCQTEKASILLAPFIYIEIGRQTLVGLEPAACNKHTFLSSPGAQEAMAGQPFHVCTRCKQSRKVAP